MRAAVVAALAALVTLALPGAARALCDVDYRVQQGDTLRSVAGAHYGDEDQWTLIYYANQRALAGQVQNLAPGTDIHIPCAAGDTRPDATPLVEKGAEVTLLTGSNYAPFADRTWPGGGLVTELVNAALEMAPSPVPYEIAWEDDWSQHLSPILSEKRHDMGFPWLRPDCATTPDDERCANFHFSEPLLDLPIILFKRADGDLTFESDADMIGRRLCRPAGYFTHDLDRADRRWLAEGKVTLVQAESPEACFAALVSGEVDAVTVNVFLGASKVVSMGLRGKVVPLDRPLSREALHVVISKTHWRGTTHLYRVNAGLDRLRESGRYAEIVQRHLAIFWDQLK